MYLIYLTLVFALARAVFGQAHDLCRPQLHRTAVHHSESFLAKAPRQSYNSQGLQQAQAQADSARLALIAAKQLSRHRTAGSGKSTVTGNSKLRAGSAWPATSSMDVRTPSACSLIIPGVGRQPRWPPGRERQIRQTQDLSYSEP